MPVYNSFVTFLAAQGLIEKSDLDELCERATTSGQPLDTFLFDQGGLDDGVVLEAAAEHLGVQYVDDVGPYESSVPEDFLERVPLSFARSEGVVALERDGPTVLVATCQPFQPQLLDDLASILSAQIKPVFARRADILDLVTHAYREGESLAMEAASSTPTESLEELVERAEDSADLLAGGDAAPVVQLVNVVLFRALRARASDVHIEPHSDRLHVRYRIDGVLHDVLSPTKRLQDAVTSRIKVMGGMDIAEKRLPQDGRTSVHLGGRQVDLRISTIPSHSGESLVLRLLDRGGQQYALSEIGLGDDTRRKVTALINYPHGILLVTGPTGSGKTTTLYACLRSIDSEEKKIITIENPIEYHLESVVQIATSDKKGMTFASGLRHVLRHDPDVIMVGEIRDLETAVIATQAAQTGHLVFSTLHTNDSAGAVSRLIHLGIEPFQVCSSVIAVLAQRLVRLVCVHCKEPIAPSPELLAEFQLEPEALPQEHLWHGRGCEQCLDTGYRERTGVYELLVLDSEIQSLILDRASAEDIKKHTGAKGLRTLRVDGLDKALKGLTTLEEVRRVTQMDLT